MEAGAAEKIGLFGGTFDPPHLGHLILAGDAVEALGLDRLYWIPARQSPFKTTQGVSPAEARLAMVEAAVEGTPGFRVWPGELHRPAPSYTVDTVLEFRSTFPGSQLYLLMGTDQWAQFSRWRRAEDIARMVEIVVLDRELPSGDDGPSGAEETAWGAPDAFPCHHLRARRIEVSSTEIRDRVRTGRSIRYLVTPEVEAVVDRLQLYGRSDMDSGAGEIAAPDSAPSRPSTR